MQKYELRRHGLADFEFFSFHYSLIIFCNIAQLHGEEGEMSID